jgi:hypothetical protein
MVEATPIARPRPLGGTAWRARLAQAKVDQLQDQVDELTSEYQKKWNEVANQFINLGWGVRGSNSP